MTLSIRLALLAWSKAHASAAFFLQDLTRWSAHDRALSRAEQGRGDSGHRARQTAAVRGVFTEASISWAASGGQQTRPAARLS